MRRKSITIIGAGVSGSALAYLCAKYTDIQDIIVVEKYNEPAQVNSRPSQNSQTLHCGDIETNYNIEKALKVKHAADMLRRYATVQPNADKIIFKFPKMVLGVGNEECEVIKKRFEEFSPHYPNLKLMTINDIVDVEPNVAWEYQTDLMGMIREEEVLALGSTDDYTAVNFEELAKSFLEQAKECIENSSGRTLKLWYNQHVYSVKRYKSSFYVKTNDYHFLTNALVVCAGGHSLQMAQEMGHGCEYSVLPVAGSFYFTPEKLNGKVYTIQNDALPFAAIHGDHDITTPSKTRFGPTALLLPMLERRNWKSIKDFIKVFNFDSRVINVAFDMFKNKDIRRYMIKNVMYEIPVIRKWLFLKEVRKIVPSIKYSELEYAKGFGGMRPQLIDKKNRKLIMGEAKIDTGDGAVFNMTPSPGGTSCVENAEIDMRTIVKHLGATIDEEAFKKDLLCSDCKHNTDDFVGVIIE